MKKICAVAVAFISLSLLSFKPQKTSNEQFLCNITGYNYQSKIALSKPADRANNVIGSILNVVGLKKNFSVYASNVDNASALVQGSSRYILYNPSFMQQVHDKAGTDWTSYSILAHEIGHHLNGHTIQHGGSRPSIELEADEFSGFVLRKMGASLSEAQSAMKLIASEKSSKTHPGKKQRLEAIARGWNKADAQVKRKAS